MGPRQQLLYADYYEKKPYITQKIKKNSDKGFLVATKESIQGQECGFAPKWKNNKSRGIMVKTCKSSGSLYIFEKCSLFVCDYHA